LIIRVLFLHPDTASKVILVIPLPLYLRTALMASSYSSSECFAFCSVSVFARSSVFSSSSFCFSRIVLLIAGL
jgi:hypothetical protein